MSRMLRFRSGSLTTITRQACRLPPFGANRAVSSSRCTTASGTSRSWNSRTAPVVRSAGPSSTSQTVVAPRSVRVARRAAAAVAVAVQAAHKGPHDPGASVPQRPTRSALQHLEDGIGGADGEPGAGLHVEGGDHTVLDDHGVALGPGAQPESAYVHLQ